MRENETYEEYLEREEYYNKEKNVDHAKRLQEIYLDYRNNYLTVECFAEHNNLEIEEAQELLKLAKIVHNRLATFAQYLKENKQ